jgi:hypothetical protein
MAGVRKRQQKKLNEIVASRAGSAVVMLSRSKQIIGQSIMCAL